MSDKDTDIYVLKVRDLRQQLMLDYTAEGAAHSEFAAENLSEMLSDFTGRAEGRTIAVYLAASAPAASQLAEHLNQWWWAQMQADTGTSLGAKVTELGVMYEASFKNEAQTTFIGKQLFALAKHEILHDAPLSLMSSAAAILLDHTTTPEPVKDLLAAAIILAVPELPAQRLFQFRQDLLELACKVNRQDLDDLTCQIISQSRLTDLDIMLAFIGQPPAAEHLGECVGARFLPAIAQAYKAKLLALAETAPSEAFMYYDVLCKDAREGRPHALAPSALPLAQLFTTLAKSEPVLAAHYASSALHDLNDTSARLALLHDFSQHSATLPHDPALTFLGTLHSYVFDEADIMRASRVGLVARFGVLSPAEQVDFISDVCDTAQRDPLIRVALCKANSQNPGLA
jgi:hypothetical protein